MSDLSQLEFSEWVNEKIKKEKDRGEEMFLGIPDNWYEHRTLGCRNGHISKMSLKSEERGDLCLGCMEPVSMIPPEFYGKPDAVLMDSLKEVD